MREAGEVHIEMGVHSNSQEDAATDANTEIAAAVAAAGGGTHRRSVGDGAAGSSSSSRSGASGSIGGRLTAREIAITLLPNPAVTAASAWDIGAGVPDENDVAAPITDWQQPGGDSESFGQ